MIRAQYLSRLSRRKKIWTQVSVDGTVLMLALFGAMLFRFESFAFLEDSLLWITSIISILVALLSFQLIGLYRAVIRFLTFQIAIKVSQGTILAVGSLYLSSFFFNGGISHSITVVFGLFSIAGIVGVRLIAQSILRDHISTHRKPVIVYGAGYAGRQLVSALRNSGEYASVAFVDDDINLQKLSIEGLIVESPNAIAQIAEKSGTNVVLLAMPTVSMARRREIFKKLNVLQFDVRTIPPFADIVSGRSKVSNIKKVKVEDLLGRDPIPPNPELMCKNIQGRVVMVTGAGGSIGSELCRQVIEQSPKTLILFELSESALYTIDIELSEYVTRLRSMVSVVPILGSVNDTNLLEQTIKTFGVETVFHAAAHKHVPMLEDNVVAAIRNNVFGTFAITTVAKKLGVKNFVLISTDKAVRPKNIMGATKRAAEMICQAYAKERCQTNFSMVRFGNVIGSSGSVIPRFHRQIDAGGPVTVTHRDVIRYFMTMPEAAQLVIQAAALSKGGDVFVLDMGDPIKIVDIAISMIRQSGKIPYTTDQETETVLGTDHIKICFTGLRKGEKIYEELLIGDNFSRTQHPRIITATEKHLPTHELMLKLDHLSHACEGGVITEIIEILHDMQLGYSNEPNTLQTSNNQEISN